MPLQSTLCYDVWVNVLALLEHRADVLAVMSTCHDLNYAGAKYALAFRVVIGSMGHLISFCEFLLRDINNRGPYLHSLILMFKLDNLDPYSSGEEDDDDVYCSGEEEDDSSISMRDEEEALHGIALLSQVFRGSPNLKCLDIQCFELLMERHQDLVQAFTQLRSLVYLRTNTFGLSSLSALEGLVAPLVTVDLCFWWPWASKAADVLRLIAPFRNTLQKAVLYLSDVSGGEYPLEATTPSFPHVRSLSLRGLDRGVSLPLMRHAFPNVQDLTMTDLRLTSTQLGHMRQQNVIVGRTPGWQSLRRLFGDFMPLYNLGLTLYRVWRVDVCRVHPHGDYMIALNHLIVTTQPSRLLIHFDHRCQSPDIDAFIHLFDPGNPCVTGFALDVPSHHVMRPDTGMVPQFLAHLNGMLMRLPNLDTFVLRIQPEELGFHPAVDEENRAKVGVRPEPAEPQDDWMLMLANIIRDSNPSIILAYLDIVGFSPRGYFFGRRPDGVRILDAPLQEAERIITVRNLHWARRAPVSFSFKQPHDVQLFV